MTDFNPTIPPPPGHVLDATDGRWVPEAPSAPKSSRRHSGWVIVGLTVLSVLLLVVAATVSGGDGIEPKLREKWAAMTDEEQVFVCAMWDELPSATALQIEKSAHVPAGSGKQLLEQVC